MELTNEFKVDVPVERAWEILTDVERIAPCLPGAELREVEGDEYRGVVKIKVGPIATSYAGTARFTERDESARRVVLKAEGRETRGQGNANALVTATMTPSGTGTSVVVVTELAITGKVAQFGRGVLADVSSKLLEQFVVNLESTVLADAAPSAVDHDVPAASSSSGAATASPDAGTSDAGTSDAVRLIHAPSSAPVNVVGLAGGPLARRLAPVGVLALVIAAVVWWRRHR